MSALLQELPPISKVRNSLAESGIEFDVDVDLSAFSYMRTGGAAQVIAFPRSKEDFSKCLKIAGSCGVEFKVVGNTSNLLFLDGVDYGFLVCTAKLNMIRVSKADGTIVAQAGVMVPELARQALFNSLTGMEGLEGIPGTLGGAIFMNAGAYGSEIRDHLKLIEVIDRDGNFREISVAEAQLTHRSSVFRRSGSEFFVFSCTFGLRSKDMHQISKKMELYHAKRHRYQEFLYPNLGSIFSGSPYRILGKRDFLFGTVNAVFSLLGYRLKLLGRESPINRQWINDVAVKRFGWRFAVQPFSDKTVNCLVNRGQGTDEMVRYVRELGAAISHEAPLENEIVQKF